MISIPYTEGPELSARLSEHLAAYDIAILEHRRVEAVVPDESGVALQLVSNERIHTRALIVATGATWRHLGVAGEKEHIGRGVAFCAHCDGPFYKGKDVVVVGGGNSGVEAAIDLAGIVKSVTVVEFMPTLKADPVLVEKMTKLPNVSVRKNAKILEVRGNGEKVDGITYEDRETGNSEQVDADGVFVQIGLVPNSGFLEGLVDRTRWGEIEVDTHGRTSAKGIYAAGDVTTVPFKQIVVAMGEGAKAGLSAFEDLAFRS